MTRNFSVCAVSSLCIALLLSAYQTRSHAQVYCSDYGDCVRLPPEALETRRLRPPQDIPPEGTARQQPRSQEPASRQHGPRPPPNSAVKRSPLPPVTVQETQPTDDRRDAAATRPPPVSDPALKPEVTAPQRGPTSSPTQRVDGATVEQPRVERPVPPGRPAPMGPGPQPAASPPLPPVMVSPPVYAITLPAALWEQVKPGERGYPKVVGDPACGVQYFFWRKGQVFVACTRPPAELRLQVMSTDLSPIPGAELAQNPDYEIRDLSLRVSKSLLLNGSFPGLDTRKRIPVDESLLQNGGRDVLVRILANDAARYCGLMPPPKVTDLTAPGEIIQKTLDCAVVPLEPATEAYWGPQCVNKDDFASTRNCVLRTNGAPVNYQAGPLWIPVQVITQNSQTVLQSMLRASLASNSPLAQTGKLTAKNYTQFGDVEYEVRDAVFVGDGGRECRGHRGSALGIVSVVRLSGWSPDEAQCAQDGILPNRLRVTMGLKPKNGTNQATLFKPEVQLPDIDLRGNSMPDLPDDILKEFAVRVRVQDGEMVPSWRIRFLGTQAECATMDAGRNWAADVDPGGADVIASNSSNRLLLVRGYAVLHDQHQALSHCARVEFSKASDTDAPLTINFTLLKPPGPGRLLILSPSAGFEQRRLDRPIKDALTVWMKQLRDSGTGTGLQLVQVNEDRTTRTILRGVQLANLKDVGQGESIKAVVDNIYFAGLSRRPLSDLNLVDDNLKNAKFDRVLYIVDSSQENFDKSDAGTMFSWISQVGRENVQIISLGRCDRWKSTFNVDCYDVGVEGQDDPRQSSELVLQIGERLKKLVRQ